MEKFLAPNSFHPKDDDVMCQTEAFCGFLNYNTTNGFWMKASEPPTVQPATFQLNSRVEIGNSIEMNFDLVGTFLNILFIAPANGVRLTNHSVGLTETKWKEMKVYYMKLTHGKGSFDPFSFSLKFETDTQFTDPVVKITVLTDDAHFEKNGMAVEYKELIDSYPDYTVVQAHQVDVSSYSFN